MRRILDVKSMDASGQIKVGKEELPEEVRITSAHLGENCKALYCFVLIHFFFIVFFFLSFITVHLSSEFAYSLSLQCPHLCLQSIIFLMLLVFFLCCFSPSFLIYKSIYKLHM